MKLIRTCILALCGLAAISCGAKEEAPVVAAPVEEEAEDEVEESAE